MTVNFPNLAQEAASHVGKCRHSPKYASAITPLASEIRELRVADNRIVLWGPITVFTTFSSLVGSDSPSLPFDRVKRHSERSTARLSLLGYSLAVIAHRGRPLCAGLGLERVESKAEELQRGDHKSRAEGMSIIIMRVDGGIDESKP